MCWNSLLCVACVLEFIGVEVRVCWSLLVCECLCVVVFCCAIACMLECIGV